MYTRRHHASYIQSRHRSWTKIRSQREIFFCLFVYTLCTNPASGEILHRVILKECRWRQDCCAGALTSDRAASIVSWNPGQSDGGGGCGGDSETRLVGRDWGRDPKSKPLNNTRVKVSYTSHQMKNIRRYIFGVHTLTYSYLALKGWQWLCQSPVCWWPCRCSNQNPQLWQSVAPESHWTEWDVVHLETLGWLYPR